MFDRRSSVKVEPQYPRHGVRSAEIYELGGARDHGPLEEPPPDFRRARRSVVARIASRILATLVLLAVAAGGYAAGKLDLVDRMAALFAGAGMVPANTQDAKPPAAAELTAPSVREATTTAQDPPSANAPAGPAIPQPAVLAMWVRTTILALHQANVTGNYSVFREVAAPEFQAANSSAGLSESFADLRRSALPLDQIAIAGPSLYREPHFDERGLLWLTGFFPLGEQIADFEMAFQQVQTHWRLFAIGMRPRAATQEELSSQPQPAVQAPANAIPEPATLVVLIRSSIAALNHANLTGNYSVLREVAAPSFQDANSLARLSELFSDLRSRGIDLSATSVIDPRLFLPAEIDQKGMLRLTGFFPSQPEQVNFDLAFQHVDGAWRLFGIGVNTSVAVASDGSAAPVANSASTAGAADPSSETSTSRPPTAPPPIPRIRPETHNLRRSSSRKIRRARVNNRALHKG